MSKWHAQSIHWRQTLHLLVLLFVPERQLHLGSNPLQCAYNIPLNHTTVSHFLDFFIWNMEVTEPYVHLYVYTSLRERQFHGGNVLHTWCYPALSGASDWFYPGEKYVTASCFYSRTRSLCLSCVELHLTHSVHSMMLFNVTKGTRMWNNKSSNVCLNSKLRAAVKHFICCLMRNYWLPWRRQEWKQEMEVGKELAKREFTADVSPFVIRDWLGGFSGILELVLKWIYPLWYECGCIHKPCWKCGVWESQNGIIWMFFLELV